MSNLASVIDNDDLQQNPQQFQTVEFRRVARSSAFETDNMTKE